MTLLFHGDTKIATDHGWIPLRDLSDRIVYERGNAVELSLGNTNSKAICHRVICHKDSLFVTMGTDAQTIVSMGSCIWANPRDFGYNQEDWLAGFLKGCGWSYGSPVRYSQNNKHNSAKVEHLLKLHTPEDLHPPLVGMNAIGSYVKGFMAARVGTERVVLTDEKLANWLHDYVPFGGYVVTGVMNVREARFRHRIDTIKQWHMRIRPAKLFCGWRVKDKKPLSSEELFPLYALPDQWAMLKGGLLVGNSASRVAFTEEKESSKI